VTNTEVRLLRHLTALYGDPLSDVDLWGSEKTALVRLGERRLARRVGYGTWRVTLGGLVRARKLSQ